MNNVMLFGILVVIVVVNAWFTYRRSEDLDSAGRKMLAASQLIYLVFIGLVFVLGIVARKMGINGQTTGSAHSWLPFILTAVVIVALFVAVLFFKMRLERKIREEHALK